MSDKLTQVELAILALIILTVYFIPAAVASSRKHKNTGAIFALNLLLGWTLLGWAIAMIWACTANVAAADIKQALTPQPPSVENVTRCAICNKKIPAADFIAHVAKCTESWRSQACLAGSKLR